MLFNKLLNWWAATVLPLSHVTANWSPANNESNTVEVKQEAPLREPCSALAPPQKISSLAAANGHDIAQEMVIELIQWEADEKVSSLRRYWRGGKEGNNRRSPKWVCMKIAPDTIRLRFNLQKKSIRAQTRCPVLIETTCRVLPCPSLSW